MTSGGRSARGERSGGSQNLAELLADLGRYNFVARRQTRHSTVEADQRHRGTNEDPFATSAGGDPLHQGLVRTIDAVEFLLRFIVALALQQVPDAPAELRIVVGPMTDKRPGPHHVSHDRIE